MSDPRSIVVALGPSKVEARKAIDATGVGEVVPNTRTVNGHPLSSDVTVTPGDVGLGAVTATGPDQAGARSAIGLGGSAVLDVGTGAGTVAAGNDPRFAGLSPPRVVTKTSDYGAVLGDVVLCDTALGGLTVTLPNATLSNNGSLSVKKISGDLNPVVVDGLGSDLIDGVLTLTLAAPYIAVTLYCDGVAWWVF